MSPTCSVLAYIWFHKNKFNGLLYKPYLCKWTDRVLLYDDDGHYIVR